MANEFKVKKGLVVDGTNTVLDIQGTQGQLFSVTDSLTGDLFSVSDISGVPILNVNSSGLSTFDGDIEAKSVTLDGNVIINSIANAGLILEHATRPTFALTDGTNYGYLGLESGGAIITGTSDNDLSIRSPRNIVFGYNGTETAKIDTNGEATFKGNVNVGANTTQNGTNPGLKIYSTNTSQTVLGLHNTTSRNWEVAVGGSGSGVGNGSFYIYDNTAADARFVIDTSGDVTIEGSVVANGVTLTGDQTLPTDFYSVSAANDQFFSALKMNADRNIVSGTDLDTDLDDGGTFSSYGAANTSWNAPASYGGVVGVAFTSNIKGQHMYDIRHNQTDYMDFWVRGRNNLGFLPWAKVWHNLNDSSLLKTNATFGGDVSGTYNAMVVADNSHYHTAANINAGVLDVARLPAQLTSVGSSSDAYGIYFRGTTEVISGEAWCTAQYAYNQNDGFLFLNRDGSNVATPVFHIGGYNNAGHGGWASEDSIITLTRLDGVKTTGSGYSHKGLSNSSYYTNIVKTTTKTEFKDAQGLHHFNGNVTLGGTLTATGDVIAYSDERLKENVKTLDGSKVLQMRGVSFDRSDTGKFSSGVIAQELEKISPELVIDNGEYKGVAYGNLSGYLIEAIKEQQKQINELKKLIENGNNL
tara:strand:- start:370 stop:2292 length:1923 start_codon:yes stop_codon:yes gene_type:complete